MMKFRNIILSLVVCLGLLQIGAFAQDKSNVKSKNGKTKAIEKEIFRLEELARQKSLNGDNRWEELMAEDAYLMQVNGTIRNFTKGQNLSPFPLKSVEYSELIVRVYGELAVSTGLSNVASETPDKQAFSYQMRFTNVWKKFKEGWKIIVSDGTLVRPYNK